MTQVVGDCKEEGGRGKEGNWRGGNVESCHKRRKVRAKKKMCKTENTRRKGQIELDRTFETVQKKRGRKIELKEKFLVKKERINGKTYSSFIDAVRFGKAKRERQNSLPLLQ